MEKWMKEIYVLWRESQGSKFINKDNKENKYTRWANLFKWSQSVGKIQRMILKLERKIKDDKNFRKLFGY